LIALLAFVLGIWLWDHYFGKKDGYAPGTETAALIRIDHDLRLADIMVDDPWWLKGLTGVREPSAVRQRAIEVFQKLAAEKALSPVGLEAYQVIMTEHSGQPLREVLGQVMPGEHPRDLMQISASLAAHRGTWWQAKMLETWENDLPSLTPWRQSYGQDNIQMKSRALWAGGLVWLVGLLSLAFVPQALFAIKRGIFLKPKGYGGAWPLSFGALIFLVATLAWIGFSSALEIGIDTVPDLHPAIGILLDGAARMLPSLIALALIFRQPSHAIRVLGLDKPIAFRALLGVFSILMVVDVALRLLMGQAASNEPGGGLNASDQGLWGLAFMVISACLLAPVAEEILFRGVLFRAARNRIGVIPAALASSAIFAVQHIYDGYGLVSVGIFGFFCALLYAGTESLATVIVLHMLYNLSIKLPEWLVYHAPLG
jgi:membrane protease YdiL (CAAX protease family)